MSISTRAAEAEDRWAPIYSSLDAVLHFNSLAGQPLTNVNNKTTRLTSRLEQVRAGRNRPAALALSRYYCCCGAGCGCCVAADADVLARIAFLCASRTASCWITGRPTIGGVAVTPRIVQLEDGIFRCHKPNAKAVRNCLNCAEKKQDTQLSQ